jgi:hypothetical protein
MKGGDMKRCVPAARSSPSWLKFLSLGRTKGLLSFFRGFGLNSLPVFEQPYSSGWNFRSAFF